MVQLEDLSDEALVVHYRLKTGTKQAGQAVEELFERYYSKVGTWCLRLTGDRERAADLTQEVFLKVLKNLSSFQGRSRFSTWVYSITRNHFLNQNKRWGASREEAVDSSFLEEVPDLGESQILEALDLEGVRDFLRKNSSHILTEVERQVMYLHFGEELTLADVSNQLQLKNRSGAKAFVVSAKRKLLAAWAERNRGLKTNLHPSVGRGNA